MKYFLTFLNLMLFLTALQAQTWVRQNPFPQLAVLEDIDMDGLYGLVVGEESTLFTTENGGSTWVPRQAPETGSYYRTACVVPGSSGQTLLAGGYNLILSRDGGLSWETVNIATQLVYKIQALPNGTLIVLDTQFGYISMDGGDTWDDFPMPGDNSMAGHFTSEMHGWVVYGGFNNNQVWVTTDGGGSWNLRDSLKHPVISEIYMMDDLVGYLGSRDFVYKTTDGGVKWNKMHDNPVNSILDLHVVNENEIWTCQNNGFIFYTLDGGGTWHEINPNIINSNRATSIFANSEGKVWVTGKYVSISYTENFGVDWTDQIPNVKSTLFKPHFFNEDIGIIGGSEGALLRTTNGGASFTKIPFPAEENFFAVQMVIPQVMVIGSSTGRVFGSLDGGATWNMIGENLGPINDLQVFDLQTAIVVTENGNIYRTTTSGTIWEPVHSDPFALFQALSFVDDQKGWACGWYGQILNTDDGGLTWNLQYADDRNQFDDIHFTTASDGWVVSSTFTDTVWHTTNGGTTWETSILPYKTFWHGVSFTNPDTGWICGGSAGFGIILRTDNGGLTWSIDHQSPEALLGIYAVPQKETVWSAGFGGNIVKYSPCSLLPQISNLDGPLTPCQRDTVTYSVESSDVDVFEWNYPSDWLVYGNSNTSVIQFIVGSMQGMVGVLGKDACGNETASLSIDALPHLVQDAVITEDSGVLNCNVVAGMYQWLLDGSPIPGANQQSYTPTISGEYEVVVTLFATGCEIRSNALQVVISATMEADLENLFIYPNPADDILYFHLGQVQVQNPILSIQVISMDGLVKRVKNLSVDRLDISGLSPGIYLVRIQTERKVYCRKVVIE